MLPPSSETALVDHPDGRARCWWCGDDPDYVAYHDVEWGHREHDTNRLFEKLCLEGFQAGLSWITVLRRRDALRRAFAGFDPDVLVRFSKRDIDRVMTQDGMIRHRGKIAAVVDNARVTVELARRGPGLSELVWRYAPEPRPRPRHRDEIPARTDASSALASELRRHGWKFIGPTSAYAFMQSMGLVDDHVAGCWRADDPVVGRR